MYSSVPFGRGTFKLLSANPIGTETVCVNCGSEDSLKEAIADLGEILNDMSLGSTHLQQAEAANSAIL